MAKAIPVGIPYFQKPKYQIKLVNYMIFQYKHQ